VKAILEIVKVDVKDIVTTSGCEYEACPGLEWDPYAAEG